MTHTTSSCNSTFSLDPTQPALLILGAGLMQRPAIQAAKSLGCQVVLVDGNPQALCVPEADFFVHLDLKDKDGIKELALQLLSQGCLQGVFTAGTDFSATVSYVGEACGFPVHTYQAACNASDKALMRSCFQKASVPSPAFTQVASLASQGDQSGAQVQRQPGTHFQSQPGTHFQSQPGTHFQNQLEALLSQNTLFGHYPLVVKPVDNMGGRGCRLAGSQQELVAAIQDAQAHSRSGRAIVEEYMDGPEFSIDALVYNGTVTICGFADRHIFFPPYFIEMGHTIPTSICQKDKLALIATFVEGIHALGLTCGAAKADIKLTAKGPMVGEIAARLSGGYMSGWTFPYSSDFFLTQQAAALALGREPELLLECRRPVEGLPQNLPFTVYEVASQRYCGERAWISIPGKVKAVHGLEKAASCAGVQDVLPRSKAGDMVTFPRNNVEKCGNILAVDTTWEGAATKAQQAVKTIILQLEPHQAETDSFLSRPLEQENSFPPAAFTLSQPQRQELSVYLSSLQSDFDPTKTLLEQLPPCLLPHLDSLVDWNYRSLRETVVLAQEILSTSIQATFHGGKSFHHGKTPSLAELWQACILGGVQGLLYVLESSR